MQKFFTINLRTLTDKRYWGLLAYLTMTSSNKPHLAPISENNKQVILLYLSTT